MKINERLHFDGDGSFESASVTNYPSNGRSVNVTPEERDRRGPEQIVCDRYRPNADQHGGMKRVCAETTQGADI